MSDNEVLQDRLTQYKSLLDFEKLTTKSYLEDLDRARREHARELSQAIHLIRNYVSSNDSSN